MGLAALAGLILLPALVSRVAAPANEGGHGLTTGFGRGRLDLAGIVSEAPGGSIDLPAEPLLLTVRLTGDGPVHLRGEGLDKTVLAAETPLSVTLDLARGGRVFVESASRIRLLHLSIERRSPPQGLLAALLLLGLGAVLLARLGTRQAAAAAILLPILVWGVSRGTLGETFTRIALVRLGPLAFISLVFIPLALSISAARFGPRRGPSRLTAGAFLGSLAVTGVQLAWFEQPIPIGDPSAYLEMGGKFADAMARVTFPFGLGSMLAELQPYLALPGTGLLYGLLQLSGRGLIAIYAAQAIAMASAAAALVQICEIRMNRRAAKMALALTLAHPSFSILPGIVQPEPFILAAWTAAALMILRTAPDHPTAPRHYLGAGVLVGLGLSLHPQGLSFLLVALGLSLVPWAASLAGRPLPMMGLALGVSSVLLPVSAAEHFSKPLAHVLDRQYGFFAYTSPHPLGFWLFVDSDGWQGPLRIEDTTYQKELIARKGETAVSSTFVDVAQFVLRHPKPSAERVLTNLHRLWHQPDNPFALPFVLPYPVQVALHRSLIVLFVMSLPALLSTRLAILALPFVMLSMTYPAYHVFNKYATPALPFVIAGASFTLDALVRERKRLSALWAGLFCGGTSALLPTSLLATLGDDGDWFLFAVRGLSWLGFIVALGAAIRAFAAGRRAKWLSAIIGFAVLVFSAGAAARTDTTRGAWSVSLANPIEVSCRWSESPARGEDRTPLDPAWLFLDAQVDDSSSLRVEANGRQLLPLTPTMPNYGLATFRGHRDPVRFRQMWKMAIPEEFLISGELTLRVTGGPHSRLFGDIRTGALGPRLSLGNWPYLSVYRLMHEGQYRLPTMNAPPQACDLPSVSGRPGVNLVRIPAGEESKIALKAAKPLRWIF